MRPGVAKKNRYTSMPGRHRRTQRSLLCKPAWFFRLVIEVARIAGFPVRLKTSQVMDAITGQRRFCCI